jgi:hypothetical protein
VRGAVMYGPGDVRVGEHPSSPDMPWSLTAGKRCSELDRRLAFYSSPGASMAGHVSMTTSRPAARARWAAPSSMTPS